MKTFNLCKYRVPGWIIQPFFIFVIRPDTGFDLPDIRPDTEWLVILFMPDYRIPVCLFGRVLVLLDIYPGNHRKRHQITADYNLCILFHK
jgi:hypothetical protein